MLNFQEVRNILNENQPAPSGGTKRRKLQMGVSSSTSITDSPLPGLSTPDLAAVSSECCTESAPVASVPASPLVTDDLSVQETPRPLTPL